MRLRFIVSYLQVSGKESTLEAPRDRTGKTWPGFGKGDLSGIGKHVPVLVNREEVFDDNCLLKHEVMSIEGGINEEDIFEKLGPLPDGMTKELSDVLRVSHKCYVNYLRLIYPTRTLVFFWWNILNAREVLVPDCFSCDASWQTGNSPGVLFQNEGNAKVNAWGINRVHSIEETNLAPAPIATSDEGPPEIGNAAAPNEKPVRREPATPTAELESEIIRILSRDFSNLKAPPTATDFYYQYVVNIRTMAGLHRANGWALRTMKKRKADLSSPRFLDR